MGVSNRGLFHQTGEVLPTPLCIEIYGFTYVPKYFMYLNKKCSRRHTFSTLSRVNREYSNCLGQLLSRYTHVKQSVGRIQSERDFD